MKESLGKNGSEEQGREIVVRIRSEADDLRDVVVELTEDVRQLAALVRELGGQTVRPTRPPALLNKREVAARLNVSVRQVDRLAAAGVLRPALRLGSAPRWRPEQLAAFVSGEASKRKEVG